MRSESLYYLALTAHGVLMALVFTTFFIIGIGYVFGARKPGPDHRAKSRVARHSGSP